MSDKYKPSPEEIKKAEDSMTIRQSIDSDSREGSINYLENRPTPEALRTEFQALLQQIDSFRSKISDRSLSGKNRQKRFKDEVGVDPKELKAYYDQLKKFRAEFIQQLNHRAREVGFSDTLDTMPNH